MPPKTKKIEKKLAKAVVAVAKVVQKKPQKLRPKSAPAKGLPNIVVNDFKKDVDFSKKWSRCLANPFHAPPPRMGCSVPTFIASFSIRNTLTLTNGFGIVFMGMGGLGAGNPIQYNTAAASDTTTLSTGWGNYSWPNASSTTNLASSCRPVAGAIRLTINLATSSVPGQVGLGLLPYGTASTNPFLGTTVSAIMSMNTTEMRRADSRTVGLTSWRPIDEEDLQYGSSYLSTSYLSTSIPYVVFDGLPAGTTVTMEYVTHWEFTPASVANVFLDGLDNTPFNLDIGATFQYVTQFATSAALWGFKAAASGFATHLMAKYRAWRVGEHAHQMRVLNFERRLRLKPTSESKQDDPTPPSECNSACADGSTHSEIQTPRFVMVSAEKAEALGLGRL